MSSITNEPAETQIRNSIIAALLQIRPSWALARDIVRDAVELEQYIHKGARQPPTTGHVIVRESHGEVSTEVYYADTIDQARELRAKLVDETGETWRIAARVE